MHNELEGPSPISATGTTHPKKIKQNLLKHILFPIPVFIQVPQPKIGKGFLVEFVQGLEFKVVL